MLSIVINYKKGLSITHFMSLPQHQLALIYMSIQARIYRPDMVFTFDQLFRLLSVKRDSQIHIWNELVPIGSYRTKAGVNFVGRFNSGCLSEHQVRVRHIDDYFSPSGKVTDYLETLHKAGLVCLEEFPGIKNATRILSTAKGELLFPPDDVIQKDLAHLVTHYESEDLEIKKGILRGNWNSR